MANTYNDTDWSTDGNTKGSATSSTVDNVALGGTLSVTGASTLSSTLAVGGDANFDSNTLFVDASTNRVGVGTSTPASILHLVSGTTDTPMITLDHESTSNVSQGGTVNFVKRDTDGAVLADNIVLGDIGFRGVEAGGTERSGAMIRGRTQDVWADGGNCGTELAFYTAQTTDSGTHQRMCIQKDGKVGIGSASPGYKLVVNLVGDESVQFLGNADAPGLVFTNQSEASGVSGGHHKIQLTGSNYGNNYLQLGRDAGDHDIVMFGSVGIGTATPGSALEVSNASATSNIPTIAITNLSTTADHHGGNLYFRRGDPDANLTDEDILGDIVWFGQDNSDDAWIDAASIRCAIDGTPNTNVMPAELTFWTNDGANSAEQRMVLDKDGRVGIGTTAPSTPLHVAGNITTTGYIIEGRTLIKIPATAFRANDDGIGVTHVVGSVEDDGSNFGMRPGSSALEFYAYIDVPLGYTATKVKITGSDTANEVEVYTLDLDDGTIGSEISNSGLTVADDTALASNHVGADDKMLLIKVVTTATDDLIYGGYVTIQTT
jgi:hypothetical protein